MTREELRKIIEGITDEQLKAILDINTADIGKAKANLDQIKAENDTLKTDKQSLETKVNDLIEKANSNEDYKSQWEKLKKEIEDEKEAQKKAKEDAELTDSITAVFGDKKFTSDYVRNGIIADMKTEIAKPENKSKSYAELFETLTKDKEGIFANPNPPADMTGLGKVDMDKVNDDTIRSVMGLAPKKD